MRALPSTTLVLRAGRIALALASVPPRYLARLLTTEEPPDAAARERLVGELVASSLEGLGATFVKLGQILGARPDLLPPGWLGPLARLQDDVAPAPFEAIEGMLRDELGDEGLAAFSTIERVPIAAASVAQVHVARRLDGRRVALKVQRPEAAAQIERDLSLMRAFAALLDRVPSLRLLSLPGAVERFGAALAAQLDFAEEAANNRRFAHNFKREKGVRVPALHDAFCTRRVLAMDFVDGVKVTEASDVPAVRAELAARGARSILKMVFEDGFVHADLHPGNILLAPDGALVFLDLGLVAEIPADLRRPWIDTFTALAREDGAEAARLFYAYAPSVGPSDYDVYERDVMGFLEGLWGVRLGDVEVSAVVLGMMNVLRRHRVQIEPAFTVVNVALLVAEGLGKQLDPSVDLVALAAPYLLAASLDAPEGRAPARTPRATRETGA